MPIVKPGSETEQLKLTMPNTVAAMLMHYAQWARTTKSRTVTVALERLFKDDVDFQQHLVELKEK